jgi:hypothetical protein
MAKRAASLQSELDRLPQEVFVASAVEPLPSTVLPQQVGIAYQIVASEKAFLEEYKKAISR